jgi:hypothetical protein
MLRKYRSAITPALKPVAKKFGVYDESHEQVQDAK